MGTLVLVIILDFPWFTLCFNRPGKQRKVQVKMGIHTDRFSFVNKVMKIWY